MRLAVLISGRGSNLASLIRSASQGTFSIELVVSSKAEAKGLEIARRHEIKTCVVAASAFTDRTLYDRELARAIDRSNVDLVVLAGFMRILTPAFVEKYAGRMINIHPSLLPRHRGLNTHKRALEAGDREHGASVHFVTAELDGGPVIAQSNLTIKADETAADLADRVLGLEHCLLPQVVNLIASGRIQLADSLVVYDGRPLRSPLLIE